MIRLACNRNRGDVGHIHLMRHFGESPWINGCHAMDCKQGGRFDQGHAMKDDRIVAVPDPSSAAWPYNDQEFVTIAAKLPSPPKGVIVAAAEYVGCLATGLLEKGAPKPNAQSKINRLAKWVSE